MARNAGRVIHSAEDADYTNGDDQAPVQIPIYRLSLRVVAVPWRRISLACTLTHRVDVLIYP
jgi:hypothetical protein